MIHVTSTPSCENAGEGLSLLISFGIHHFSIFKKMTVAGNLRQLYITGESPRTALQKQTRYCSGNVLKKNMSVTTSSSI